MIIVHDIEQKHQKCDNLLHFSPLFYFTSFIISFFFTLSHIFCFVTWSMAMTPYHTIVNRPILGFVLLFAKSKPLENAIVWCTSVLIHLACPLMVSGLSFSAWRWGCGWLWNSDFNFRIHMCFRWLYTCKSWLGLFPFSTLRLLFLKTKLNYIYN